MTPPRLVYEVHVRATPQALWRALVDPAITVRYFAGLAVESTFEVGSPIVWRAPEGPAVIEGVVFEHEPPARLVHSYALPRHPEARPDRPTRVTWEIDALGESCKLTLVHDEFEGETATWRETRPGWNAVLSGLKALLESDRPTRAPR